MFFINEVFAGEASAAEAPTFQNFTASIVPLLIFIVIFYFLLIRPQQKRQKDHEKEVSSLKPNDKVLTAGGIYATVLKIKEGTLVLEIAKDVEIEVLADTVSLVKDYEKSKTKEQNKK